MNKKYSKRLLTICLSSFLVLESVSSFVLQDIYAANDTISQAAIESNQETDETDAVSNEVQDAETDIIAEGEEGKELSDGQDSIDAQAPKADEESFDGAAESAEVNADADWEAGDEEEAFYGYYPIDMEEEAPRSLLRAGAATDAVYDSRQEGYITSVKNQGSYGTCWAFSASAAVEASLVKNQVEVNGTTAKAANTDLSELHAAYFFYNKAADPLGNTDGDQNVASGDYRNVGGNTRLLLFNYTNWVGAVNEDVLPYEQIGNDTQPSANLAYQTDTVIQNGYFVASSESEIKRALTMYGALSAAVYYNTTYLNGTTGGYRAPTTSPATDKNHAITIVGWDDTYSKDNFKADSGVTRDGAWIVKNSYGSDYSMDGYYYISYEDTNIGEIVAFEFQENDKYQHNYQYDGSSSVETDTVKRNGKIANVYQAKGSGKGNDEILKAVSFAVNSVQVNYTIQIYTSLQDSSDPTSGKLATSQTGETFYQGYYTEDLKEPVRIRSGEYYSVVITLSGKDEIKYFVESTCDYGFVKAVACTAPNQSFADVNGDGSFQDLHDSGESARIKAFTIDTSDVAELNAPVIASITSASYSSLKLTWNALAGAEGYQICRMTSQSGTDMFVKDAAAGVTAYTSTDLSTGRTYYFKVRAYRSVNGTRVYSADSTVKTGKTILNPTTLSVSSVSYNSIKLKWNKVTGADGYQIMRSISKTAVYTTVKTITSGSTLTYTNSSLTTGRTYYYKIRAYRWVNGAKVYSGYSEVKSKAAKLSAAAFTSVKKTAGHAITLKWKKVSGASGYVIYRATSKNGTYKKIKTITKGSTISYKNGSLKKGTYYYKIRAYRTVSQKKVYGSYSTVKYAKIS